MADPLEGVQEAAAWHGMAHNEHYNMSARLHSAFGALEIYEREYEKLKGELEQAQTELAEAVDKLRTMGHEQYALVQELAVTRERRRTAEEQLAALGSSGPRLTTLLTWDWKEHAPIDDIARAARAASGGTVSIQEVQTYSDMFAVIIAPGELSEDEAIEIWNKRFGEGE